MHIPYLAEHSDELVKGPVGLALVYWELLHASARVDVKRPCVPALRSISSISRQESSQRFTGPRCSDASHVGTSTRARHGPMASVNNWREN
eukprot:1420931-Pyramimonas_sp.AAC.1